MPTRRTHDVRCRHDLDHATYVDVTVVDAIVFSGVNGEEIAYSIPAKKCNPFIKDEVGAGLGKGDKNNCTRVSHVELITFGDQQLYVEVLDGIALRLPALLEQHTIETGVVGATPGLGMVLDMNNKKIVDGVIDKTGSGLEKPINKNTTRVNHIAKISELDVGSQNDAAGSTSTEDPGYPRGPLTGRKILVQKVDAIGFSGVNGEEYVIIFPKAKAVPIDTTGVGPTGVPPDNTDPNFYVKFPKDSKGPWVSQGAAIKQGPLWWIKAAGQPNIRWFYYFPKQQPVNFAAHGGFGIFCCCNACGFMQPPPDFPRLVTRGPYASHICTSIFCHDYGEFAIGPIGFDSLEDAILNGSQGTDWDEILFKAPPTEFVDGRAPGEVGNVWQQTGLTQPVDSHRVIQTPQPNEAATCARTWGAMWNGSSESYNAQMAGVEGVEPRSNTGYPTFLFKTPLLPSTPEHRFCFTAGIHPAFWFFGGDPDIFTPAYATRIIMGQLDPIAWDLTGGEGTFPLPRT